MIKDAPNPKPKVKPCPLGLYPDGFYFEHLRKMQDEKFKEQLRRCLPEVLKEFLRTQPDIPPMLRQILKMK